MNKIIAAFTWLIVLVTGALVIVIVITDQINVHWSDQATIGTACIIAAGLFFAAMKALE